jgi:2-C-methyl-D-erythritol 4-phosphate cytidylyltransferase / 2-C-methyl-D-erythritol 2,4-cyclodiphosphate synthase
MGGVDKLFAPIDDRPLLAWTLDAIDAARIVGRVVVVTAADRMAAVAGAPWLPASVIAVVAGGSRRQESVAAGFAALDPPDERVILVHDGARPMLSQALIETAASAATSHGAAIPVLAITETVKRVSGEQVVETLDRTELATAQTPQAVRAGLLRAAWAAFPPDGGPTFTDEAGLLEAARIAVHAIPGDPTNLKVTTPSDLLRASAALLAGDPGAGGRPSSRVRGGPSVDATPDAAQRVGLGSDSHPFGPGEPLALGGIAIAGAPRLHGHSDGDVALHAVADALLGAAGLGDLGRLFPAGPETPRGISSGELLAAVVGRVRDAGYDPVSLDLTIVGARPRLVGRLDAMRDAIGGLVGLEPGRVAVKASTGNLVGMEGAGRGISAQAIAVLATRS